MSPFRAALLRAGLGEWAWDRTTPDGRPAADGVLVRVAKVEPLTLAALGRQIGCVLLCLTCALPAAADPPKVSARVVVVKPFAPGQLEVYVRVPFSAENRAFEAVAWCDGVDMQRSVVQLDDDGPFPPIAWRDLSGCAYSVRVTLLGAGGKVIDRTPAMPVRILCVQCDDSERDEER